MTKPLTIQQCRAIRCRDRLFGPVPQWDGKVIVWQPAKRATVTMEWLQPKIKEAMAAVDALSPVKRGLVHEFNLPWVWQYRKLADATILVEADKERERRKA